MRETVYEHIDGNDTFTVTAAERWSIANIKRLAQRYPDKVCIVAENKDGSILARVPSDWMRIVPKRTVNLTDDQRAEFGQRMRDYHKATA